VIGVGIAVLSHDISSGNGDILTTSIGKLSDNIGTSKGKIGDMANLEFKFGI
jgi:hypothetical protein